MIRLLALVILTLIVSPQATRSAGCDTLEGSTARVLARLDAAEIKYNIDPEKGIGVSLPDEAVTRFNSLYESATTRVETDLIVQDRNSAAVLSPEARARLAESTQELEEALQIYPLSWNAEWVLGKIHQRLGDHESASSAFRRSFDINSAQPDVAREAGLEALELGQFADAECFFLAAIAASPQDNGLYSNLALAHLFQGELDAAVASARRGAEMAPEDQVALAVQRLVRDVKSGRRPAPRTFADLP